MLVSRFSLKFCIIALPKFNRCFFNFVGSRLVLTLPIRRMFYSVKFSSGFYSGLFTVIAQAKSWEFCAGIRRSCIALRWCTAVSGSGEDNAVTCDVSTHHVEMAGYPSNTVLWPVTKAPRLSASIFFIRQLAPWLSIERVYNTRLDAIRSVFPLVLFDV